jgi:GT2 family glycosyltransferase
MKILIVIVVYNNAEKLINNIRSIRKCNDYNDNDIRITILDNSDNSQVSNSILEYCDPIGVEYCKMNTNMGYFGAINKYLFSKKEENYKYVIIGNDDLLFSQDFFSVLNSSKYENNIFVVAPNIIRTLDRVHQNPHVVSGISLIRRIFYYFYYLCYPVSVVMSSISILLKKFNLGNRKDVDNNKEAIIIKMGYGACYILTDYFLKKIRRLDKPPFLMGEEAFLSNQVRENGGNIIYDPTLLIYHEDHSSTGKIENRKVYNWSKESYKVYRKYLND